MGRDYKMRSIKGKRGFHGARAVNDEHTPLLAPYVVILRQLADRNIGGVGIAAAADIRLLRKGIAAGTGRDDIGSTASRLRQCDLQRELFEVARYGVCHDLKIGSWGFGKTGGSVAKDHLLLRARLGNSFEFQ